MAGFFTKPGVWDAGESTEGYILVALAHAHKPRGERARGAEASWASGYTLPLDQALGPQNSGFPAVHLSFEGNQGRFTFWTKCRI